MTTADQISPKTNPWRDTAQRYGLVSRILHWAMAYLLIWQFVGLLTWKIFGDSPIARTVSSLGPSHGAVGLLVFVLVMVRAAWWLSGRSGRPPHASGWEGRAALLAHVTLYGLMFAIPALALLRSYGGGKGWKIGAVQLIPETGVKVAWMIAPADRLHGLLAWGLSILILGHIGMALVHRFVRKDGTLARMAGSLRA
ncbi:cytochrome b [Caulobacter sp. RHG1]|uniref:cytochrome b n=1 Tax=Caulobacter sp. (strain RHG1) TaxID=2545762 RepID=UPI001557001D|nr:cytochrome b [Caulobacter sp. RHG1]NQE64697.1 hypothetical protein [Caulobacter sp. RHG1]